MNHFDTIVNPLTNRKVSVYSTLGRRIINNYIQAGGDAECKQYHGQPIKCQASPDCQYIAGTVKGEVGLCKRYSGKHLEEGKDKMRQSEKLAEKFEMDAAERLKRAMERNKLNKEIATRVEKKNTPKPVVVDCGKYNTPGKTLSNKCRNDPNCKLESGKNKKSKKQRRCVPI